MIDFSTLYQPLTATPFQHDSRYQEVAPAHPLLRPWIRCLWGGKACSDPAHPHPVIPDTCTDLIFRISSTGIHASYCALNDQVFFSASAPDEHTKLFAVRFYPWAAPAFMQDTLRSSLNCFYDARWHFPALTRELEDMLCRTDDFGLMCRRAEAILLRHLDTGHLPPALLNAMTDILQSCGGMRMDALACHQQISPRQLERLFCEYTGVSPKKLSSLIRYQCLWRDAVSSPRFDVQDAVLRFGYADQSHLLREFRRYHGMTLTEAVRFAHVGFLQYRKPPL